MDYRNFTHSSLNDISEIDIGDKSASMAHGGQPEVVGPSVFSRASLPDSNSRIAVLSGAEASGGLLCFRPNPLDRNCPVLVSIFHRTV
jgi:hypothetical protein